MSLPSCLKCCFSSPVSYASLDQSFKGSFTPPVVAQPFAIEQSATPIISRTASSVSPVVARVFEAAVESLPSSSSSSSSSHSSGSISQQPVCPNLSRPALATLNIAPALSQRATSLPRTSERPVTEATVCPPSFSSSSTSSSSSRSRQVKTMQGMQLLGRASLTDYTATQVISFLSTRASMACARVNRASLCLREPILYIQIRERSRPQNPWGMSILTIFDFMKGLRAVNPTITWEDLSLECTNLRGLPIPYSLSAFPLKEPEEFIEHPKDCFESLKKNCSFLGHITLTRQLARYPCEVADLLNNLPYLIRVDFHLLSFRQEPLLALIPRLKPMPKVTTLVFSASRGMTDRIFSTFIRKLPNLTTVDISGCPNIEEEGFRDLATVCRNLRNASIEFCELKDASLVALTQRRDTLRKINCSTSNISDLGMGEVANTCLQLMELRCSSTNITNASLFAISENCHNLTSFDCSSNQHVTDEGVLALVERCRKMQTLLCFDVLTKEGLARIRRANPRLIIYASTDLL